MKAIKQLQETYSEHFGEVFKTITTDKRFRNSPIFQNLRRWLIRLSTMPIPTHPAIRETVERHNGLIRIVHTKG